MSPKQELDVPELQSWIARFGVTDPAGKWRNATTSRAPYLAFVAIAADGDVLSSLAKEDASRLANDADIEIANILLDHHGNKAGRPVAELVKARIDLWRRRSSLHDAQESRRAKVPPMPADADAALVALVDDFPRLRATNARFVVATTLKLGPEGLANMHPDAARAMTLGAARVAARSAEARPNAFPMPRRDLLGIIRIVQDFSVLTEISPFDVRAYPAGNDLITCVAGLAIDADACAELAAQLPEGALAAGFTMWEEAVEIFGYALLRCRRFLFDNLEPRRAMAIASAGGRLAQRAINDPSTRLPFLPDQPGLLKPDDPQLIAVAARDIVQGPFLRRRSDVYQPTPG
ncbi:MAG: hypothetical protein B7Z80_05740 [Rhodospirillales bacterium 20-64-7]|nr:MAG: hypothetical protein B7Z80_05740 [Rhodospirillales bacterium 20-64-7]HQT75645.1 hypothetical protein [Rhodopila sp.]